MGNRYCKSASAPLQQARAKRPPHRLGDYSGINSGINSAIKPLSRSSIESRASGLVRNLPMTSPLFGQMMDVPLLASSLISHAGRHSGDTEIGSRRIEGDIHRYTWRDCEKAAKQLPQELTGLDGKAAERIGTLP